MIDPTLYSNHNEIELIRKERIMKAELGSNAMLFEIAWEVCNQVGGIYTVIRSKATEASEKWGDNYCLVGPYLSDEVFIEFARDDDDNCVEARAAKKLRDQGIEVYFGRWLVSGRPKVILINPNSVYNKLVELKKVIWERNSIPTPFTNSIVDGPVAFGYLVKELLREVENIIEGEKKIIAHFHEWMAGVAIPQMRYEGFSTKIIFTTHATMLGRYLAQNTDQFYRNLHTFDWKKEAKNFDIESQVFIERAAAHGAHLFTTVSDVTARECIHLLGRKPDIVLPNGLNIERFAVDHELQNRHKESKLKIHQFIMGHFFPSYSFDLNNTLYFFTSGRFEYKNKGFDLTLEALKRLNEKMIADNSDTTVVMFFITRRPYYCISPNIMHFRALLEKIRGTCDEIERQIGDRMFYEVLSNQNGKFPPINEFVDDVWKLKLKRALHAWKRDELPPVVTHTLKDPKNDEILNFLDRSRLVNHQHDKVKIIYHPEFLSSMSPINQQDYDEFVRGCHLGVFPSYYEPWGYTPLECIARGIPTVTSNLSGFGDYAKRMIPNAEKKGVYVVDRINQPYHKSVEQLSETMMDFVTLSQRERIKMRNRIENASIDYDWKNLYQYYETLYQWALG